MYLLGYSLDNLSLMALAISTGFVVDDAIVVLENITRHLEEGVPPVQAAFQGASEIGFTVLSMSTSLVAVFIPILLMGGIVGRLFREFAVTLSVAIGVSLVVSLTTTPMMCAKFLRPRTRKKHGRLYRSSEKAFDSLRNSVQHGLRWVLRHQFLTLLITIGTAALSIYLYIIVPKGFFPQQDTGRIRGSIQAEQDISFQAMRQKMNDFVAIMMKDPAVDYRDCLCRWRRHRQHGPHVHHVEAAGGAQDQRRSGHRQAARQTGRSAGRDAVSAIGPGPAHRRPHGATHSISTRCKPKT